MALEVYSEILALLATILGTAMSIGYFPQIYKIYKRKSSADVSVLTYMIFIPGILIWLFYGLSINNTPLIIANIVALFGASGVVIACFAYKK